MKILTLLLLFISATTVAQNSIFKWEDECSIYESTYDSKKVSKIQLKNCHSLVYNYYFTITNTPKVYNYEDIKKLNLDSLDNEYKLKINKLNSLDLPNIEFWIKLRKLIRQEIEQCYTLSRTAYLGYKDPIHLKKLHYEDSCLRIHIDALIEGGDSLLKDWYSVTTIMAERNGSPKRIWDEYNTQLKSIKKYQYARVTVMRFGWWNTANHIIKRTNEIIDDIAQRKEFLKLFITTKVVYTEEP